jgi:hypothetical protein
MKNVAVATLSLLSSAYSRESFFSTATFVKPDVGGTLLDTTSAACIALRTAKYTLIQNIWHPRCSIKIVCTAAEICYSPCHV